MTYTGGKNGSGVFQTIINQIPPHHVYVELFLGAGAIMQRKLPAQINVGVDQDQAALTLFKSNITPTHFEGTELRIYQGNALEVLRSVTPRNMSDKDIFLYLDPPYPFNTRKDKRPVYSYEFGKDEEHIELLDLVNGLPSNWMVAISTYPGKLYDQRLGPTWRRIDFQAKTRQGMATEVLWMNYAEPKRLHDYRYLGSNYRERERIKKKQERWRTNIRKMDRLERLAMMSVLAELDV